MNKERLLIKNAQIVDPFREVNEAEDILIENAKISKIEKNIFEESAKTIEATNKIILPALVDMHVHLREPGREDKETVASGTKAALKGGIVAVLAMPNTNPTMDSPQKLKLLKKIISQTAFANVFIAAAITKKREGKQLNDFKSLKENGAIAVTDDGSSVEDEEVMRCAFREAKKQNLLVICHCEDESLSQKGVVNLGFTSTRLGLRGISKESEYKRVARDIAIAKQEGARIHIAHVSCRETVEIIACAKKEKVSVTAETAPHYFSLNEEAVLGFDTNMKINPPLRAKEDVEAIKQALKDGTIDVIASDHAPHTPNEKDVEFEDAAFGVIGLETELGVTITELVHSGILDWRGLVSKMSYNPAKILGINKGRLEVGSAADLIVVSPNKRWEVKKESFISKSRNSCFLGKTLQGVVEYTIYQGQIVYAA